MKPLAIQKVVLTHFKNYSEAHFILGDKFNLISGLNGTGKTNLLDAIYYLSVGKSYFTPFDQRVVKKDEAFFRLEGDLTKDQTQHKIIIKVRPGTLKELILDGIPVSRISDHLGFLPVVISAPRDIELVTGHSQSRRRYIDHLLCQTDQAYLHALLQYNYLLQMRNAALKKGYQDLHGMIRTYDHQMAPHAALIFEKRKWLVENIQLVLQETYSTLAGHKESVDVQYASKLSEYTYEVVADMNWELDKNTARSNAGIHKDEFELSIDGMSAKEYGSQGQIKSLIFAMHLSKYKVLGELNGFKPVLILDDIFDKLDERRLHRLTELLSSEDIGQVFISDTSKNRISEYLPADRLHHIDM